MLQHKTATPQKGFQRVDSTLVAVLSHGVAEESKARQLLPYDACREHDNNSNKKKNNNHSNNN